MRQHNARATPQNHSKTSRRYNPAQLRWERDDRNADASVDDSKTIIVPKTGAAYQAWPVIHTVLSDSKLQTVSPEEAKRLQASGWTLVDVRLAGDFDRAHAAGAVSAPMYRFVEGTGAWDNLKRAAMAAFAMRATERNTDFVDDLLRSVKKNQRVLLMCAIGGTLDTVRHAVVVFFWRALVCVHVCVCKRSLVMLVALCTTPAVSDLPHPPPPPPLHSAPKSHQIVSYRRDKKLFNDPERAFGRESRSLKAAYELLEAGWSAGNIKHVDGGFQQWRFQGLPVESSDD
jgi:rhodanese-related sulfurtransferase